MGSIGAAKNAEGLLAQGVTHVLSLVSSRVLQELDGVEAAAGETGTVAHHMVLQIDDRPDANIGKHFEECFEFIDAGLTGHTQNEAGRANNKKECNEAVDGAGGNSGDNGDKGGGGGCRDDDGGAAGAGRLEDRKGGVLVHCYQGKSRSVALPVPPYSLPLSLCVGKSRSVAIVTGYLMARRGLSFVEANETVRAARPQVTKKFMSSQLTRYQVNFHSGFFFLERAI